MIWFDITLALSTMDGTALTINLLMCLQYTTQRFDFTDTTFGESSLELSYKFEMSGAEVIAVLNEMIL